MAVAWLLLLLASAAPALSSPTLSGCKGFECTLAYVTQPDSHFAWKRKGESRQGEGWSYQVINMTSQRYLDDSEGHPPIWWHLVAVVTPDNNYKNGKSQPEGWANIVIGDGGLGEKVIPESDYNLQVGIELSLRTGAPTAVIYQVPNQPTVFTADPERKERKEDAMRAFGWRYALDHPWAYHMVMELADAKAVVRALDMMAELKSSSRFLVTGFSKRGLATWISAAVDSRIRAIMPGCHDLNINGLVHEEQKSYGALPFFAKDYADTHLASFLDTDSGEALFSMIDPHHFPSRLEGVEKYIMAVSNDDFFTIDQSKNWWDSVKGSKVYHILPNQRHVIQMHKDDHLPSAVAFAQAVLHDKPRPKISWTSEEGVIRVWQEDAPGGVKPKSVRFYTGQTCESSNRRDFRKLTDYHGKECFWCGLRVDLFDVGGCLMRSSRFDYEEMDTGLSEWVGTVEAPEKGWRAGFFEFVYDGPLDDDIPWEMSTTVTVMPDSYPFQDCVGSSCSSDKLVQMPKG